MKIPVYSEQALSPRASEVLRAILDERFPNREIQFRLVDPDSEYLTGKVLVFGKPPEGEFHRVEFVKTYSIAQMMVKANAASVIAAAIQHFITEPVDPPFGIVYSSPYGMLQDLDFTKPTVIDIETNGNLSGEHTVEEVSVISIALYQEGGLPVVFAGPVLDGIVHPLSVTALAVLAEYLPKFEYTIWHNGKFDTRVLNRVLGVKLKVGFDTMLAHHVLNHAAGDHKLKHLAQRYFNAPEWEADLSKYTVGGGHYERIPRNLLVSYNGWDVYWTYKLWEFLAPQIEADEDNVKALTLEMAAADFLLDVETYGIPFNEDYATAFSHRLQLAQTNALSGLEDILSWPLNPNSPKQVKEYLATQGHFVASTDVQTLTEILEHANGDLKSVINLILAYRKAGKTKGTYADGWKKRSRNGRVHPTYLVHGTSTGRLSSTNPNAQNVPRDKNIRKLVETHG